jgi:rubredoxin
MLRMCLQRLEFSAIAVATICTHCSEAERAASGQENKVSEPKTWMCLICGWIYDEATGDPEHDIAPGTPWEAVPMNWTCPECGARKEDFEMVQI